MKGQLNHSSLFVIIVPFALGYNDIISFEADFIYPDKQQMDVYDIEIVLNNALENAIEASSKVEGRKSISLRSYMKGTSNMGNRLDTFRTYCKGQGLL